MVSVDALHTTPITRHNARQCKVARVQAMARAVHPRAIAAGLSDWSRSDFC